MVVKLTNEQSEALHRYGDSLALVDPKTHKVYVLVDQAIHQQASQALQDDDSAAIQQGITDMEAGRGMTLEESKARTTAAIARFRQ